MGMLICIPKLCSHWVKIAMSQLQVHDMPVYLLFCIQPRSELQLALRSMWRVAPPSELCGAPGRGQSSWKILENQDFQSQILQQEMAVTVDHQNLNMLFKTIKHDQFITIGIFLIQNYRPKSHSELCESLHSIVNIQ